MNYINDPIKVIYKYKNNSKIPQYQVYLFLGSILPKTIKAIIEKIADLNLMDTIKELTTTELKMLNEYYGSNWVTLFFNSHYLKAQRDAIVNNAQKKKELASKMGEQWVTDFLGQIVQKKLSFGFATNYHNKNMMRKTDERKEGDVVDFRTKTGVISSIINQTGGSEGLMDLLDDGEADPVTNETTDSSDEAKKTETEESNTGSVESENEMNVEDLENMYQETVEDKKEIKTTQSLLEKVLGESMYKKKAKTLIEFDSSKDNIPYEETLDKIYKKKLVFGDYLYKDDTIMTIKQKICQTIENNKKFIGKTDHHSVTSPSRMYLYSEYQYYEEKINKYIVDKVMIGHKWIRMNELLMIDIEPNPNLKIYEELRGNLFQLRESMRRYGSKIRYEDDDYNILHDYEDYMTNNEIYMIDIYNELGVNFNSSIEGTKNMFDIYVRIYFPKIRSDEFRQIIDYLQIDTKDEKLRTNEIFHMSNTLDQIRNTLLAEQEIMNNVEQIRADSDKYAKYFKDNYITQSVIHVLIGRNGLPIGDSNRLDLYRIFNNFLLDHKYPFVQWQTSDGQINFKYDERMVERGDKELLSKWFENAPYGISFKVRVEQGKGTGEDDRFIGISLTESGRIEYKTQWKETDMATIDDVKHSFIYVKELITKLNKEQPNLKIDMPVDDDFKFAFVNSIQAFSFPEKYIINHNDLSDFSRYFYPYVALVIDPRKRESGKSTNSDDEMSKFGTYLRYKRISNFENQTRIEMRILFLLRNFDITDKDLVNQIAKQFNITDQVAFQEVSKVKAKYPNIRKARKNLKKVEEIPRYKPPGIDLNIQGKSIDKYKIRVTGARSKSQLFRILSFVHVLLYLYVDTYLVKNPARKELLDKLKGLTNIAKRKRKVEEIVIPDENEITVKKITALDKGRLGFKPKKGENQWTRSCQNSGDTKRRRPFITTDQTEIEKLGYVYDASTKLWVKKTKYRGKEVKLLAVPLEGSNQTPVFYTCNPENNGEYMHIGFLSKSSNPNDKPMPCCFKKNHFESDNKEKQKFFLMSIGALNASTDETTDAETNTSITNNKIDEKLYVLGDTNKLQENKYAFLSKHMDILFNKILGQSVKISNHYLTQTDGYFFRYGIVQDRDAIFNAFGACLGMTGTQVLRKVREVLSKDTQQIIFTRLNNGDIRTQFKTIDNYMHYLETNDMIDINLVYELLSLPGVLSIDGINMYLFVKKTTIVKTDLNHTVSQDVYVVHCMNPENQYELEDDKRMTIMMVEEDNHYYPIFKLVRRTNTESINVFRTFYYQNSANNIVKHVYDFYKEACDQNIVNQIIRHGVTAKNAYMTLVAFIKKTNKLEYTPKYQLIDPRNKCRFIICQNGCWIPVAPSGSLYNLKLLYHTDVKSWSGLMTDLNKQLELWKVFSDYKMKGVYYNTKKGDNYEVNALVIEHNNVEYSIPIQVTEMNDQTLNKLKLDVENRSLNELIDVEITKGSNNKVADDRSLEIARDTYIDESYELFRMELANYLKKDTKLTEKIKKVLNEKGINKTERQTNVKKQLYKISDRALYSLLLSVIDKMHYPNKEEMSESPQPPQNDSVNDSTTDRMGAPDVTESTMNEDIANIADSEASGDTTYGNLQSEEVDTTDIYQEGGRLSKLMHKVQRLNETNTPPNTKEGVINTTNNILPKEFIYSNDKPRVITSYKRSNDRDVCEVNTTKDTCNASPHCYFYLGTCKLSLKKEMVIYFINKVANELVNDPLRSRELLNEQGYQISDIVSYGHFKSRPNQKIVSSQNTNINNILSQLFGQENIPRIGKRRYRYSDVDQRDNLDHPLETVGNTKLQLIDTSNRIIFRAICNALYWLSNPSNDVENKNLGYTSMIQIKLSSLLKSEMIKWMMAEENESSLNAIMDYLKIKKDTTYRQNHLRKHLVKLNIEKGITSNYILELAVLSILLGLPILVLNEQMELIYVYDNGIKLNRSKDEHNKMGNVSDYPQEMYNRSIVLQFNYMSSGQVPNTIKVVYI